jgi:hypothetical protein
MDNRGRTSRHGGPPAEPLANHSAKGRVRNWYRDTVETVISALVVYGLMTVPEDPDREPDSQATNAPAPAAETPTRLQEAAAGMAEAQAWKGEQISKGWRKLVNALRRPKGG